MKHPVISFLLMLTPYFVAAQAPSSPASSAPYVPGSAVPASLFIDSIGIATHFSYPSYVSNMPRLATLIGQSGIKHIRDGAIPNAMRLLSSQGIKETMVLDPPHGVVPTLSYWAAAPPAQTFAISDYIKTYMPTAAVEAVEMPNELDVFYKMYRWHVSDSTTLSNVTSNPNYYGAYGQAVTRDTWKAIKSDPALRSISIIGPTVGIQVPSPYPDGSLYDYVDFGGFHPYPGRANTWTYPAPYATIPKYYWNSSQPSVNVSSDSYGGNPLMFTWYQKAFSNGTSAKPMIATETGYSTAPQAAGSISVTVQAKYIPRLFAEYFRDGIARTFVYELYDEGTDPGDSEQHFGLIYNNLVPKPAFTALASLIHLLQDSGTLFTPASLAYSLQVQGSGSYTRTGYVHDLLLQQSDGDFYLLLWHEVADSSNTGLDGNLLTTPQRDITPPALMTTINLPTNIVSATSYTYDASWALQSAIIPIARNAITVPASDTITVVKLVSNAGIKLRIDQVR